jgi:hypothetical protein
VPVVSPELSYHEYKLKCADNHVHHQALYVYMYVQIPQQQVPEPSSSSSPTDLPPAQLGHQPAQPSNHAAQQPNQDRLLSVGPTKRESTRCFADSSPPHERGTRTERRRHRPLMHAPVRASVPGPHSPATPFEGPPVSRRPPASVALPSPRSSSFSSTCSMLVSFSQSRFNASSVS